MQIVRRIITQNVVDRYEVSCRIIKTISQQSGEDELTIALRLGAGSKIDHPDGNGDRVVWTMEDA